MKIIQTLATWGTKEGLLKKSFGWLAPEYHLMSWALSSTLLRKYYPSLTLYSDPYAAEVLVEDLRLPYTEVHPIYENMEFHGSNTRRAG